MNGIVFEAVVILFLMLANGFFAASEIAIVSARKGRLEQQAQAGHHGARVALDLADNPNRFLSTAQVGITVIGTFAAAFGGARFAQLLAVPLTTIPLLAPYANTIALTVVVIIISYLSLILGELAPKRLALQSAESIAVRVAPVMRLLSQLASPAVSFLTFSTEAVLRFLGRQHVEEMPVTEDDIMALVREGAAGGTVEPAEQDLIDRVFALTDRTVRSLMTPRTQVVAIDSASSADDILQVVTDSGYSRFPVYEHTLDRVIGMLYIKDVVQSWGRSRTLDLHALLRPALYLPDSQRAVAAFQQLKQQRSTLAIVLDEYGQVAGVVSVEDILEELVGDIADEYDETEEPIKRREDGSYLVEGLLPFDDLHAALHMPDAKDLRRESDFETVAGFVLALLERVPSEGDSLSWEGYVIEVIDMDGRRIDKLLIIPPHQSPADQTEGLLATRAMLPPADPSNGTNQTEI